MSYAADKNVESDRYFNGAGWRELIVENVLGRPTQVWKERPRHVLELLDLAPDNDLDFIVQGTRRISFREFRAAVETAASEFAALNVRPGDKVLLLLFNCPEVLLSQWALWRLGAIPAFGNRWWSEHEVSEVINRVQPALVITDLPPSPARTGGEKYITPDVLRGWWVSKRSEPVPSEHRQNTNEDDLAEIVFTAGSSGTPKGVKLSHRNLVWTQQTLHNMGGGPRPAPDLPDAQKVTLMTVPMFHNGAIVTGISALIDGNRLVLTEGKFDPQQVLRLIQEERVTSWQAVPTMFNRVLHHPNFSEFDVTSLVAPASGGTMIPPSMLQEIQAKLPQAFAGFVIGYGMTEMSFVTMATARQILDRPATVGKPIPGAEVSIFDPDVSGEGEVIARSGALMIGYLDDAQSPIDDDGWYHTGDLGRLDDEGFVFITGRVKDVVIRGGENISCARVETALAEHDCVMEVAVTGYPDEEFGEALIAFVRPRPDSVLAEEELRQFARSRLAYFEIPSRWIFAGEPLPVLATGKIDKRLLSRQFVEKVLRDA